MLLTSRDIAALEKRHRAALINSITGYKPAILVGSADSKRQTNLAIMSSLVHLGSNPPLLALIFRPDNVDRHTLSNICKTGAYTINHVNSAMIDSAHQTAARYPREISEFTATSLTEHWESWHPAPFVAEATVSMAMQLREDFELAINGTHMVIGEILSIKAPDAALNESGALDPALADGIAISGLDSYYRGALLQRMAYAKPDTPPRRLTDDDNV